MTIVIGPCLFTKIEEEYIGNIWFQQDGATCHTTELDVLRPVFEDRTISRRADVVWPPRSWDLTPLEYYLWVSVKDKCYADKPETIDASVFFLKHFLKERICGFNCEVRTSRAPLIYRYSDIDRYIKNFYLERDDIFSRTSVWCRSVNTNRINLFRYLKCQLNRVDTTKFLRINKINKINKTNKHSKSTRETTRAESL